MQTSDEPAAVSSPGREALGAWRVFFECALALPDVLDAELREAGKLSLRWYDVLVNLEEVAEGVPMSELADRILASKSGLTRVIDKMGDADLVRRERPPGDRRVVLVHITDAGRAALEDARQVHRDGIRRQFVELLDEEEIAKVAAVLEKVRAHVRPLRPGRMRG